MFKDFVEKNISFPGKIIDQNDESFSRLSLEFSVSSVPTLIIFEDESMEGALLRTSEITEIYDFIQSH